MSYNLQKILTLEDVKSGKKRLGKKNKYKNPYGRDFLRYATKERNKLWFFLKNQINTGEGLEMFFDSLKTYEFAPYVGLAIPKSKPRGKFRPLLVPEPKDRLVFDSLFPIIKRKLEPILKKRGLLGLGLEKNARISVLLEKIYNLYVKVGSLVLR